MVISWYVSFLVETLILCHFDSILCLFCVSQLSSRLFLNYFGLFPAQNLAMASLPFSVSQLQSISYFLLPSVKGV